MPKTTTASTLATLAARTRGQFPTSTHLRLEVAADYLATWLYATAVTTPEGTYHYALGHFSPLDCLQEAARGPLDDLAVLLGTGTLTEGEIYTLDLATLTLTRTRASALEPTA